MIYNMLKYQKGNILFNSILFLILLSIILYLGYCTYMANIEAKIRRTHYMNKKILNQSSAIISKMSSSELDKLSISHYTPLRSIMNDNNQYISNIWIFYSTKHLFIFCGDTKDGDIVFNNIKISNFNKNIIYNYQYDPTNGLYSSGYDFIITQSN